MSFRSILFSSSNFLQRCCSLGAIRTKHSKRQIKRLMAPRHPAYLRKVGRPKLPELPTAQFAAIGEPKLLPNHWSKPLENRPDYPFSITRTKNKPCDAIGFLPVYSKKRKDGTKVITRIKKVTGDRELFQQELRALLQSHKPIRISAGGTIEIAGSHVIKVKKWLASLGF